MIINKISIVKNSLPDSDGLYAIKITFYSENQEFSEFRKYASVDELNIEDIIAHKNVCCMSIPEDVIIEQ